ncbi:hypothetical protein ILYODFUR_024634 [Ilyodon furcidens]|uniref:Uncharacterized protein n=2 Tax=Goodeidae TaxID=28758 RepID=A0ABV0UUT6_9TELE
MLMLTKDVKCYLNQNVSVCFYCFMIANNFALYLLLTAHSKEPFPVGHRTWQQNNLLKKCAILMLPVNNGAGCCICTQACFLMFMKLLVGGGEFFFCCLSAPAP